MPRLPAPVLVPLPSLARQVARPPLRALGRLPQLFVAAVLAAALIACGVGGGGGGSSPPPPPPPPPANQAPVASFSAAATVAAGAPLAFDASASTDADNDALTFSWDFGDGTRGGGARLAHVFTAAGSYTVRLTVADGRGASGSAQRTVTVSGGAAAGAPATLQVAVSDGTGPLAGVAVSVVGATGGGANTAADGKADIAVPTGASRQLKFTKAGYADQFKPVTLPTGGTGALIEVRMLAREAPLTLADAAAGGTLAGKDGARIVLPANALVDANGQPVTGAVQISMTPVNVGTNAGAFPGAFQGLQPSGARGLIASYGTVEYVLTQNGAPVQLAPGRKATIEIPVYTSRNLNGTDVVAGAVIPLWSLDERTGLWVQEGTGTVVANSASPSELALRAEVGHFSWWNCDQWLGSVPEESYNPNGRCCIKDTPNGPCKENSGDVCSVSGSPRQNNQTAFSPWLAGTPHGGVRAFAVDPATRRIPTTVATAQFSALTGGALPMPANLDIDVVATARNGTYRGTRTFRGGAGVVETVVIDLLPVAGGGNDDPITLPWDQVYSMAAAGEVDRFRLTLPVGPGFELRVAPSGSVLAGTVRVTRPGGGVIANAPFNASTTAYVAEPTVATAGDYQIEITAGSGAPGAYRLDGVSFGACSSTETLVIPAAPTINLGPNQSRCYDITLAADEVINADIGTISNGITGSVSLATAGGVQTLVSREYPAAFGGSRRILTGVSVAGTYRLRATNRTLATGSFPLTVTKPAAQVLTVPASVNVNATSTPQLFLVKPPADGLFFLALANTGGQVGAGFEPSLASFLVATTPTARVQRVAAPVLPVVSVFRNSGTGTVTVSTGAPTPLARDTDVSGTATAGSLAVYAFDANIGDAIAYAQAVPQGATALAGLGVFAPSGVQLGETSTVQTLTESGVHTALITPLGGTDAAYTLRVNNAPAPVALALTPPVTAQPFTLPLGQVLRYTFDVAAGDLLGLKLDTAGALNASATLPAVQHPNVLVATTPTSGNGPFSVSTGPGFASGATTATLTLRSTSTTLERAGGSGTLSIIKPAPLNATVNATVTGTPLALDQWVTYRFAIPATGRYLLRLGTSASTTYGALTATVWAPSTPFASGYAGEFSSTVSSSAVATEGLGLLAAAGNYTVSVRRSGITLSPDATPFTLHLVDLEAPVALTAGAAATAGSIDVDGERDYFSFAGTSGQAYTVRVTPTFNGTLRLRKLNPNGDFTNRLSDSFNLGGTPVSMTANAMTTLNVTIPADTTFGSGTYIVEINADGAATGGYTVQLTSP